MIKNNYIIVILITLFVASAVFGTGSILEYMESPSICSKCHAMEPYYGSYSNSEDYPLIKTHKDEGLSCIDCHSPPGKKNRDHVRIIIIGKILPQITPVNISVDMSQLKVNCIKCHDVDTTFNESKIDPHAGVQSCEVSCHIAHDDLKLGDIEEMDCANCHVKPAISGKHVTLDCDGCHPTHGRIPSCIGCHSTHEGSNEKVENSKCLECHGSGAHSVIIGSYNELSKISMSTCGTCHQKQYLKSGFSAHGNMETCIGCHPTHGLVRECGTCHRNSKTALMKVQYNAPVHMAVHPEFSCSKCHAAGGVIKTTCISCHSQDPHTI